MPWTCPITTNRNGDRKGLGIFFACFSISVIRYFFEYDFFVGDFFESSLPMNIGTDSWHDCRADTLDLVRLAVVTKACGCSSFSFMSLWGHCVAIHLATSVCTMQKRAPDASNQAKTPNETQSVAQKGNTAHEMHGTKWFLFEYYVGMPHKPCVSPCDRA